MITKFKLFEKKEDEKDWKLKLDISKIWKDTVYDNANELLTFNDQYINFLNSNKDLIVQKTSENAWIKLQELITRLTENKEKIVESNSVWDDIYDWGDTNMIEIKTENDVTENNLKTDF
jgi:putative heme iron utilization protein